MAQTKYKIRPKKPGPFAHIRSFGISEKPGPFIFKVNLKGLWTNFGRVVGSPSLTKLKPISYKAVCTSPKRNMNYHTKSRQAQSMRIREHSCVMLHLHPFSLLIICYIIIIIVVVVIIMRNTTFSLVCFFPLTSLSRPSLSLSYYYFCKFHL